MASHSDRKHSVQSQFSAAAGAYARAAVHASFDDLAALVEAAAPVAGARVLDVGSGAGHTALALATGGAARVIALDLTPAMIAEVERAAGERGLDNLSTRLGDAEALPFDDQAFDLVSCRLCAHHFPNPERALTEVLRVLRPGGRFVLSDTISPEDHAQDSFLNAVELLRDPSHVRNHRASEWLRMLRDAGFEGAEQLGGWPCPLDFDEWVERMQTPKEGRAALRFAFAAAPSEVREALGVGPRAKPDFTLPFGLFRAHRP